MVRNDFKMCQVRRLFAEEEIQQGAGNANIEIEGSVDELEASGSALPQRFKRLKQLLCGQLADGQVNRRKAKFTAERAASGGLDIQCPMQDIFIRVVGVGQVNSVQYDRLCLNESWRLRLALKLLVAELSKCQVRFTLNDMIGCGEINTKRVMTDFRSTECDDEFGFDEFE